MPTVSEALSMAVEHHQNGRLQVAEQIYQQILQVDPNQPVAYQLLGVIAQQDHRRGEAIACFRRAIELAPDYAEAYGNLGATYTDMGKMDEAVDCYRRAIEIQPKYHQAHNNLGLALKGLGKFDQAIASFRHALELKPDYVNALNNLGNALKEQGNSEAAIETFGQALKLNPQFVEAHNNLGNAYSDLGELDLAFDCYQKALRLRPEIGETHSNIGNLFKKRGELEKAIAYYRRALELKPNYAIAHNNLGVAFNEEGRLLEAVPAFRKALELEPNYVEALGNLGQTLSDLGDLTEAMTCYQRELALNPQNPDIYVKIGNVCKDQGKLDEALSYYFKALKMKPNHPDAHNNVGNVYKDQGKLDEAIASFQQALELTNGYYPIHSNVVYTQLFTDAADQETVYQQHQNWNQRYAEPLAEQIKPHENEKSTHRRLRIGYVSPDFRTHPVGRFISPLLEAHNRQKFEVFCYASVRRPDAVTDRCRLHADTWRNAAAFSDEKLADQIRQDQIDILIDLTMHMGSHRLLTFARKPAPVQVTYLAYCGTTGLGTIDYRLTDPYLDPHTDTSSFYSEKSVHLPETYWCYEPPTVTPVSQPLPVAKPGQITFGSFNNFCKVGPKVLATWAKILQAVPHSRLVIHTQAGSHRDNIVASFVEQGISKDRLVFMGYLPMDQYLGVLQQTDIALDPFPYSGGTTTCDALWMGTPVVSLAGSTAVGRGGLSILTNIGLPELVAHSPEEYIKIAAALAEDRDRLSDLKAGLRERMQTSPLMDKTRFAQNVEAAYQQMWKEYCEQDTAKAQIQ